MLSQSSNHRLAYLVLSLLALVAATGCPVVSNLSAPGRVMHPTDPECGRSYHLYVPSNYGRDPNRRWPLVITCHGTRPFDTAPFQFSEWKGLAEREGFILVAPELVGTSGFTHSIEEQIRLQQEDERAILSIIRAIRGARSIERSQIFLTGWSAGGYAVLFTGLRHPEIFRALAVRQGNFQPELFEPCLPFIDPHQSIQILFGSEDVLLKKDSIACIDWLRKQGLDPVIRERPGTHQRDSYPVFEFFTETVRSRPWIRIRVEDDPDDPLKATFRTIASFKPVRYQWDFGDGQGSQKARAQHRYKKPGQYHVRIALWASPDKYYIRKLKLDMPRMRLGVTPPASAPAQ